MTKFIAQGRDSCCFVYAAANWLIFDGRPVPNLEQIKDIACCRTGATINERKVLDTLRIDAEQTTRHELVFERGGILIIQHPIYNLHAVFVASDLRQAGAGALLVVNSWLGPTEACMAGSELVPFLPKFPVNQRYYARKYFEYNLLS